MAARSPRISDADAVARVVVGGTLSRRQFVVRGAGVGMSLSMAGNLLAACGGDGGGGAEGGRLTVGVTNAVGNYDSQGWSGFTANIAQNHIYQGLVRLNFETSAIEPALAESWEKEDDLTYRYTLREGATFHNGDPVTTEDIEFTIERAKRVSYGAYALTNYDKTIKVDNRTVQVKLSRPDWRFQWFFYWPVGYILSKKHFESAGDDAAIRRPVGTNAFKLKNSSTNQIVLERFEGYWEEGLPYLDEVVLEVLDGTTVISGLRTGELGLSPDVGFDQLEFVHGFDNVDVRARVGAHIVTTYLNMTEKPFNDLKVRQAIAEALDNQAALAAYPREFYEPSPGPMIHPSIQHSIYDELKGTYTGNLEKAKALLAESSAPNGFTAEWQVAATRPQELSAVLGAQERLAEIGIKIDIRQRTDPDIAGATFTRPRPFQMITYNWLHNQPHALEPMSALLTTAQLESSNFPGYSNEEYDRLVAEAVVATDEAEIADKLAGLQRIHIRDVPLLVHGWDALRRAESTDLETPEQTSVALWDDWFRVTRFKS